jgi:hypothetical protein
MMACRELSSRSLMFSCRFKSALEKHFSSINQTTEYARLL